MAGYNILKISRKRDFMNTEPLFKNIPSDKSPFWDKEMNTINYKEFAQNIFDKQRNDRISRLTGVSKTSVRYDNKMPQEVKEFLDFIATIFHLVYNHFNHDFKKTKLWFQLPNPMIGKGCSPKDMIFIGRHKKLFQIVSSAIKGESS